jgi:hypothetical protein
MKLRILVALSLLGLPALSRADDNFVDPKYQYGKQEAVKEVIWKVAASLGFAAATGNSRVLTLTGGANASRNDGDNKLTLDANGIYAVTTISSLNNGAAVAETAGDISDQSKTTAANFLFKARYDRFFKEIHSIYLVGFIGLDEPASKLVFGGAQLGYAVAAVKTKRNELSLEAGADYTGTLYSVPSSDPTALTTQVVHIASARLFAGYTLTLNDSTSLTASVEGLINLHHVKISGRDFGAAEASRIYGKLALTTKLYKALSFRAAFNLRFDDAPAARTDIKICAADGTDPNCQIAATDTVRFHQKVDTLTEIGLVATFL